MVNNPWRGVFTFPVSTMNADGSELDLGAYRDQVEYLIEGRMHGITTLGSIGEFAYLRSDERNLITKTAVDQARGRVPVMAGVSAISTVEAVDYAKAATDVGASGLMIVLQSYFHLTQDEIVAHYRAISESSPLPLFIYNNTGTSGHDIDPALIERLLAEVPAVTGIKESSAKLERTMELLERCGDRLQIFVGWEPLAMPMFQLGVESWACGIGNFVPTVAVELWEAAVVEKDFDRAMRIHQAIWPLSDFILRHRLAACVKPGLELMGRKAGGPRRPVTPIDGPLLAEMRELLDRAGAALAD